MLGTYFSFLLVVFALVVVGAVLSYTGDLKSTIKMPLEDALKKYEDQPTEDSPMLAYKEAWNEVQEEVGVYEYFSSST